jgi:hypothetical protein
MSSIKTIIIGKLARMIGSRLGACPDVLALQSRAPMQGRLD